MKPHAGTARTTEQRFRHAYATLRDREGRGSQDLLALPYLRTGPWAAHWRVRARTYERFVGAVVENLAGTVGPQPLRVLDLGAGNGWLCYRLQIASHEPVAVDWRSDAVDGLGAAGGYDPYVPRPFPRVAASFTRLPFPDRWCDLAVFNASLHYATDLAAALAEATRTLRPHGRIAILDSPFYRRDDDGRAMVEEKRTGRGIDLGPNREDLIALDVIEYLTAERLRAASRDLDLTWRRYRVRYPLRYELRPLWAALRGQRAPSRFDVWEGRRAEYRDG